MTRLAGKQILVGVTGGIAAYKAVELVRRVDGVAEALAGPEPFEVVPLRERGLREMTRAEYAACGEVSVELGRAVSGTGAVIDETRVRLDAIKAALASL